MESQRAAHLFENMRGGLIAAFLCDAQARQAKTSGGECIRSGASIEARLRTPPSHGRCECGRANASHGIFLNPTGFLPVCSIANRQTPEKGSVRVGRTKQTTLSQEGRS